MLYAADTTRCVNAQVHSQIIRQLEREVEHSGPHTTVPGS